MIFIHHPNISQTLFGKILYCFRFLSLDLKLPFQFKLFVFYSSPFSSPPDFLINFDFLKKHYVCDYFTFFGEKKSFMSKLIENGLVSDTFVFGGDAFKWLKRFYEIESFSVMCVMNILKKVLCELAINENYSNQSKAKNGKNMLKSAYFVFFREFLTKNLDLGFDVNVFDVDFLVLRFNEKIRSKFKK